jgi:regulator of sigma D
MANISLNCLIVLVGNFNDVQCNAVYQMITISTGQHVSDLENAIRARLELEDVPLSLYQIHPRSVQEKKIEPQEPISKFFGQ